MARNGRDVVAADVSLDAHQNGTEAVTGRAESRASATGLTREMLRQMQSDPDIALPESVAEEPELVLVERPGRSFITVHPSEEFAVRWAFVYDPLRSDGSNDPYLVLPPAVSFFEPEKLYIRWLMLCLRFEDDLLKPFLWAPGWYELGQESSDRVNRARRVGRREEASPFHKSVDKVVRHARAGWGEVSYRQRGQVYVWRPWPVELGEEPGIIWPDADFLDILNQTFADRIIANGNHPLVKMLSGRAV